MKRRQGSIPPAYFDALYAANADPWNFTTSSYERDKYDATLAALPSRQYERGLEIGCSIGVLTSRLSRRCSTLLAVDVSDRALAAARARCRQLANVAFQKIWVPAEWPTGHFDLVVLSELI